MQDQDTQKPCSFCGEIHPTGPVGEPGTWLAGIESKTCPKIPEDCVFIDAGGGELHRLKREP